MPIYSTGKKAKSGKIIYRAVVSYTDAVTGKHRKIEKQAEGKTAALAAEQELREQSKFKAVVPEYTVDAIHEMYVEQMSYELRRSSIEKKKANYRNHIQDFLGKKDIRNLDVRTLNAWKVHENKKGCKLVTRKNAYSELKAMLNWCVKLGYISQNPLNRVDTFKDSYDTTEEMKFYTPEEFKQYIAVALENAQQTGLYDYYVFFMIAYYTGCRKGEIHALRWDRYKDGYLYIRESLSQKLTNGYETAPPKNKSSIRKISVPTPLAEALDEHKARQQQLYENWTEQAYICGFYQPLADTSLSNFNTQFAHDAGLKRIRIHDFRHSHASRLINNGVNVLAVAKRLGHSNTQQTLKVYAHLFPAEEDKALEALNSL